MKAFVENPKEGLMLLLAGLCIGLIAWQVLEIFSVNYEDIQRKKQTTLEDETPLTHFISNEALRNMQTWLVLSICALGAFYICLSHDMVSIPIFGLLALVAWFGPPQYYAWKVRKRQEDFEEHILEFIMLLASALRGGLSIEYAIDTTSKTIGGSIEEEFGRVFKEYRLGLSFDNALSRINQRIDCENLKLFTIAVSMAKQNGGSMETILENIVETIRKRKEFDDQLNQRISKIKSQTKSVILVQIVMLPLFFYGLSDIFMPLCKSPIGWVAFCLVGIIMISACLWLKKLTTIDI